MTKACGLLANHQDTHADYPDRQAQHAGHFSMTKERVSMADLSEQREQEQQPEATRLSWRGALKRGLRSIVQESWNLCWHAKLY